MVSASTNPLGVDVGGTFTDLVALSEGRARLTKVASTPADQSEGVERVIARSGLDGPWAMSHGTTIATNALLEHSGARTALVTTEGFRDLIEIGRQARADLYDLARRRPPPLVPRQLRFTVRERMGPHGVVAPLDPISVANCVGRIAAAGVDAVAVCLLFAFADPSHELIVRDAIAAALPQVHISVSCHVLPEFREFERMSTTVADAYVAPQMKLYLSNLGQRLGPLGVEQIRVMQSSGGVASIEEACRLPASCVLSGPAGGVAGARLVAASCGFDDVITMDIGGTSADVATILRGQVVTSEERSLGGVSIRLPALDIRSVGAGGGSLIWVDGGGGLRVGPQSAGARPGPACYGLGGSHPTISDAFAALGHLRDGMSLGDQVMVQRTSAEKALAEVAPSLGMSVLQLAEGALEVGAASVALAVRQITLERGLDPRSFALEAFGGAGGLFACAVAEELGIDTVIVPAAAGLLSALGLAMSDWRSDVSQSVMTDLNDCSGSALESLFTSLEDRLRRSLPNCQTERHADLRYRHQAYEMTVLAGGVDQMRHRFDQAHEQRYGYCMATESVQLVNLRVTGRVEVAKPAFELASDNASWSIPGAVHHGGCWIQAPRVGFGRRLDLAGPAVVELPGSTCWIAPGWRARCVEANALILERT